MANTTVLPDRRTARASSPVAEGVTRTPFYLESRGQKLFAWLHYRGHAPHANHGVMICPPIGHEQVHAHRSLRHLADALAAGGFSVLRFDYHGTGDSAGSEEDPDRVAVWLANIRDAHDWLRQQLGCQRVSSIGLRLGAALAAQAAGELPVDNLLLWVPVVKGRSYVREMRALSLTAVESARTSDDIEATGFVLSEQTARDLSGLDLMQIHPLCRRALILTRDDSPNDTRLLEHFKALGMEARQFAPPGYADMMAEPHDNQVPGTAIDQIVAWLSEEPHDRAGAGEEVYGDKIVPAAHTAGYALLSQQRIRERVLAISPQPNLFGILSEPLDASPNDLPTVVLLNAGSSYRVGPNRLYVSLARQLAVHGFRSLRLDLCGLGDSVSPDPKRENDPYPATAFRDIDLTLQHLRSHLGCERVVLMGLCSGAYAAFQSAAQLSRPILVESVLINPLTFFWREGMSLQSSTVAQLQSFQDGMTSLRRPGKWLKLLSGRSKIGILGAIRMLLARWRLGNRSRHQTAARSEEAISDGPLSHPLHEDLPDDLERVSKAGRYLSCFFARSDPGYGLLMLGAKQKVKELLRAGRMSLYFFDDADHTFSRRPARRALAQAITDHLGRRYHPGA